MKYYKNGEYKKLIKEDVLKKENRLKFLLKATSEVV